MLSLREMTFLDVDQVYEIECESFSMPWTKDALNMEVEYEGAVYFVAEIDNQVVAYAGLRKVFDEGHITNLAVKKDFRGQGISKELVNALINSCREKGMYKFTLEVRVNNHVAIKLYERLGFVSVGKRRNYYEKPKEDAIIMWKEF